MSRAPGLRNVRSHPQEAGKTETMTVAGLPAGAVHFAVKAWDGADNVSALSNVVSVEVK